MQNQERIGTCLLCGNSFVTTSPVKKYCSRKCQREYDGKKPESEPKRREALGKSQKAAVRIAEKARQAGMSYGQYVAAIGK